MRKIFGTKSNRLKMNSFIYKNKKNTIDTKEERPINEVIVIILLFLIVSTSIFNIITINIQGIINNSMKIKEKAVLTNSKS
jgi:hypothetical protein